MPRHGTAGLSPLGQGTGHGEEGRKGEVREVEEGRWKREGGGGEGEGEAEEGKVEEGEGEGEAEEGRWRGRRKMERWRRVEVREAEDGRWRRWRRGRWR